jgi:hypothetical protein
MKAFPELLDVRQIVGSSTQRTYFGLVSLLRPKSLGNPERGREAGEDPPRRDWCIFENGARSIFPERFMRLQKIILFLLFLLGFVPPSDRARAQVIIGRLLDGESMQPIRKGFVQLLDTALYQVAAAQTDDEGGFVLRAPGPGEYLIQVEALSYHNMQDGPVALEGTDTMGVEFFVLPKPEELDPIIVEAERTEVHLRTAGFYRRKDRGMGSFITREDIEEIRPYDVSSLLLWGALPVILRPGPGGYLIPAFPAGRSSTTASGAGWCHPFYFVDGLPFTGIVNEGGFLIHPNEIAAVEVYATRAETPAQFRDPRARCGTVLIWTRWEEVPLP